MPPLVEVAQDALVHCPAAPQALSLLSLPGGDLASAGAARRYVRVVTVAWGLPPDTADALETITGELAANSLEYSASLSITVALSRTASAVVVSVSDEGQECVSVPDAPGPEQECGRGLLIVGALAARWGQRRTRGGLTVWAEITTAGPVITLCDDAVGFQPLP
nr:ATP-binding protein [Streptomyces flavidovirens]